LGIDRKAHSVGDRIIDGEIVERQMVSVDRLLHKVRYRERESGVVESRTPGPMIWVDGRIPPSLRSLFTKPK
jgi:hypothetical protein